MADNIQLNLGVGGSIVRSEDLGGVQMPVSKIYVGAHGVDGGPVSAGNPLPVSIQGSVVFTGSVSLSAGAAAIGSVVVSNFPGTQPVSGTFWQTTQPVSGVFWQTTQPISAASLPLPTGASQEHVTAASPHSVELSDGAAFYTAAKTGQLPAALDGSGGLKVAQVLATPAGTNLIGQTSNSLQLNAIMNGTTPLTIQSAAINFNSTADQAIIAGVGGKNIYIISFYIQPAGSTTITVKDSVAGTALTGPMSFLANQPFSKAASQYPHFVSLTGGAFTLSCGTAVQVSGWVKYVQF